MQSMTTDIADLNQNCETSLRSAAELLSSSVHHSIGGLVPYHATGYAAYLKRAVEPRRELRTMLVRLILENGCPAGAADWRILQNTLFLNGIAISISRQGRGFARRLIADGEAIANSVGLHSMSLDVVSENKKALSIYRRLDFKHVSDTLWHDLTPTSLYCSTPGVRVVNWSTYRSHMTAYGFADLTLRKQTGEHIQIRQVGKVVCARDVESAGHATTLLGDLAATQIVLTGPDPANGRLISSSSRLIRTW